MHLNLRKSFLAFALVASCAATASAANLVVNGDFQTGTFSGWTVNETTNHPWFVASGANDYASDGCIGSPCIAGPMTGESYLYQDLATVTGATYTLTFDYFSAEGTPNELAVYFGGVLVDDLVNLNTTSPVTYTLTGLVAPGGSTRLEFLGRQDPTYDYLDNISVTGATGVTPEPATFVLVGSSMLGLAGAVRRRFARS